MVAVGQIQVAKQYHNKFSRVLIFAVWDSFSFFMFLDYGKYVLL